MEECLLFGIDKLSPNFNHIQAMFSNLGNTNKQLVEDVIQKNQKHYLEQCLLKVLNVSVSFLDGFPLNKKYQQVRLLVNKHCNPTYRKNGESLRHSLRSTIVSIVSLALSMVSTSVVGDIFGSQSL